MSYQSIQDEMEQIRVVLDRLGYDYYLTECPESSLADVCNRYMLPELYRGFLGHFNPVSLDIRFGKKQITFYACEELADVQDENSSLEDTSLVIGQLNAFPLFLALDEIEDDAEDCAVYCLDDFDRIKVASSFLQLLKMLHISLDILGGDSGPPEELDEMDEMDEQNSYYSEYRDFEYPSTREQMLKDYYEELAIIDPDCVSAWAQS